MGQRSVLFDVMRGIAIILVVIGHAGIGPLSWAFIYSFHMPLFFYISGCFCNVEQSFKQFFIKRIKSLYFPFVKLYTLFIIASPLLHAYKISGNDYHSFSEILQALSLVIRFRVGAIDLLGQFWFLPVLFFISIIAFILIRAMNLYSLKSECLIIGGDFCH